MIVSNSAIAFCIFIDLACLTVILLSCNKIKSSPSQYKLKLPFFITMFLVSLNIIIEIVSTLLININLETAIYLGNFYLFSLLASIYSLLWFSICLNGERNLIRVIILLLSFSLLMYLHSKGLIIDGFRFNGFSLVRVPGPLYWLYDLYNVLIASAVFITLFKYASGKDSDIRSRAIITIFALTPVWIYLSLTAVLMRFSDNYSPIIFTPIFFAWASLVMLLATGRAVVDLSFNKQHIQAYKILLESATTKDMHVGDRMQMIEKAWYLLAGASTEGDIDKMIDRLGEDPDEFYRKVGKK